MSPSTTSKSEVGETSSYEHMEQALIRVASKNSMNNQALNNDAHIAERPAARSTHELSRSSMPLCVESNDVMDPGEPSLPFETSGDVSQTVPASSGALSPRASVSFSAISGEVALKSLAIASSTSSEARTRIEAPTGEKSPSCPPKDIIMTNIPGSDTFCIDNAAAGTAVAPAAATLSSSAEQSSPPNGPERSTKSKGGSLRRGKWTAEEETYVARVIQDFNSGFLNAPAGTTLRSYLSDKLQCDPMRITKKFTGDSCIGKRVFHPAVRSAANATSIDKAQAELEVLEGRWRRRLEMQQRDSAKKAIASAAAANVASRAAMVQGVPVAMLDDGSQGTPLDSQLQQTAVTQAASWLDRANAILRGSEVSEGSALSIESNGSAQQYRDESTQSSAEDSLENQIREVQRLIYEGPVIQQTTAGLPQLLLQSTTPGTQDHDSANDVSRPIAASSMTTDASDTYSSPSMEPADKRMKTTRPTSTGAEDAEALVGFLRSVRASAAAGQDL